MLSRLAFIGVVISGRQPVTKKVYTQTISTMIPLLLHLIPLVGQRDVPKFVDALITFVMTTLRKRISRANASHLISSFLVLAVHQWLSVRSQVRRDVDTLAHESLLDSSVASESATIHGRYVKTARTSYGAALVFLANEGNSAVSETLATALDLLNSAGN
jgi:hypothetical protein